MKKQKKLTLSRFIRIISIVFGLVMVWRGIWHVLDWTDLKFFGGSHIWTDLIGISFGLLVLYVPDRDLKEIEKL
jgi:hypothetical protein